MTLLINDQSVIPVNSPPEDMTKLLEILNAFQESINISPGLTIDTAFHSYWVLNVDDMGNHSIVFCYDDSVYTLHKYWGEGCCQSCGHSDGFTSLRECVEFMCDYMIDYCDELTEIDADWGNTFEQTVDKYGFKTNAMGHSPAHAIFYRMLKESVNKYLGA
jgi:hypothetical protein